MGKSLNNTPISYLLARYKAAMYEQCIAPLLSELTNSYAADFELLIQPITQRAPTSDASGSGPSIDDTGWYREKIGYYEQSITGLELLISEVTSHCEGMKFQHVPEVNACYQRLLRRYESQLDYAHSVRRLLFKRLHDR